ncbi:copper chaperone [Roseateles sp. YR242]|uniref:heavy-metal-associated domain-containing protein n=1 Tax=Roseateles sp. YR242 TaxID=1855305 RepID=UPI0008B4ECD0|nr:heavy-metal-associated domain-containing protein [Roseateles sp. YR242]SEK67683.1 copper chaperone [Roseateles sp. YR242]
MYEFKVPDMSCGHCLAAVTEALKDADAQADVQVSLEQKTVKVQSALERERLAAVLAEAGYPPAA